MRGACRTRVRILGAIGVLLTASLGCDRAAPVAHAAPDPREAVCGAMPCELFDTPEQAFASVLAERPRVLAIGETHAQTNATAESATARFTDTLLPMTHAKDMVLELWVGNGSCAGPRRRAQQAVASAQREVTATQSPKNQGEFLALWGAARRNGVRAHVLVPACDEYLAITRAPDDVDAMLEMIARLSADRAEALVDDHATTEPVLIYGGAMHNDLAPRPGHERWSFGPRLDARTGGRYVELDLIVPELIRDTEAWRAQPWYPHFDRAAQRGKAVLFAPRPRSFALVFP